MTATVPPTLTPAEAAACRWPVVIVGAGLAGIAAALELRRTGVEVLLLDKAHFPRAKTCGGCLISRSVRHLAELGCGEVLRSLGGEPLGAFELHISGRRSRVALRASPEDRPVAVSRHTLDAALVREAIGRGVQFLPGAAVQQIEEHPEGCRIVLHGHDTPIRAEAVILAEGLAGTLARRLGLAGRESRHALLRPKLGVSAILPAEAFDRLSAQTISMFAGAAGYAGLVRVEGGQWNLAAAMSRETVSEAGRSPQQCVLDLLDENKVICERAMFAKAAWQACPIFPRSVALPETGRVLPAGDSAGYLEPITGEGMAWALEAGRLAGRELGAGWSPQVAGQYAVQWRKRVGNRRKLAGAFAWALQSGAGRRALKVLLAAAPQLGSVVSAQLNRQIGQPS